MIWLVDVRGKVIEVETRKLKKANTARPGPKLAPVWCSTRIKIIAGSDDAWNKQTFQVINEAGRSVFVQQILISIQEVPYLA